MGFMDVAKNTADELVNAVSGAVKDVSDKGREYSEKSKLNRAIKDEETKINNLYNAIGKKFFESNPTAPAGYEAPFNGIRAAMAEKERLNDELRAANNGMVNTTAQTVCPKCGKNVAQGQRFCQNCGNNLIG